MTLQMLAWGTERMGKEIPDIDIRENGAGRFNIVCDDIGCDIGEAETKGEAEDAMEWHRQWHEDGMPE